MFLIDDILLAPARGLFMIFRELHEAAQQEQVHEAENIRTQLSELYILLETGQVSEQDFDERERTLLDRLDELEALGQTEEDEEDAEEDEDFEEADEEGEDTEILEDEEEIEVGPSVEE